jgi:polysaccharide export outer membrane protein
MSLGCILLFIATTVLVAGCAAARGKREEGALAPSKEEAASAGLLDDWQPPTFESNYRLGPGDVVEIAIFQLLELNTNTTVTLRISEEGYVTLPVLGNVRARELTAQELEREIAHLLEKGFLVDPQVSVMVKEYRSRSVLVFGAVGSPGIHRISQNESTVLSLLSQAGGVKSEAGDWLYVLRAREKETGNPHPKNEGKAEAGNPSDSETTRIDLRRLLETGDQSLNIAIKHGDVINVPPAEQGYFFASGAVMKPGIYPLRGRISVLQGLAVAGGLARRANPRNVEIIRGSGTPREEKIILDISELSRGKKQDKDVCLWPGDLLVVHRVPLAATADFLERIFSFGVSATYDVSK